MYVTQRIRLKINKEDSKILDKQSLLVTKHYNYLLELALSKITSDGKKFYMTSKEVIEASKLIANSYKEFQNMNISFIIGNAYTINESMKKFNLGQSKLPKFQSSRLRWMSLFFTNKGTKEDAITLDNQFLLVNITKENKIIRCKLNEELYECNKICNYRIVKEMNKYYVFITVDKSYPIAPKTNKAISIDLNHANFFMAIGSDGIIYEMDSLHQAKYFDNKIAELTSKRDKRKKEKIEINNQISYKTSKGYKRIDRLIKKLNLKRDAQIRQAIYMICNFITNRYDTIAIGDYTPSPKNAITKAMARSMITESYIAKFREKLEFVCKKKNKKFILVNERNTTMICHNCGYSEPKNPSIRFYCCPKCKCQYLRDVNSAINIGIKANVFIPGQFKTINLTKPTYICSFNLYNQKLDFKKL